MRLRPAVLRRGGGSIRPAGSYLTLCAARMHTDGAARVRGKNLQGRLGSCERQQRPGGCRKHLGAFSEYSSASAYVATCGAERLP